ncbi:MAG TPA: glutaminyl-peptide cyclotransferase [Bryobacteraceae bacterium]
MTLRFVVCWMLAMTVSAATPEFGVRVVHVYPHDRTAFTQGLEIHDGLIYEGTGLEGHSDVRVERLETGAILRRIAIAPQYFGEGITVLAGQVFELTWQAHQGFVYSESKLQLQREFRYPGEGWGLTNDGNQIYMSDGTAQIRIWNANTLHEERRITVHDGAKQIDMLNELECVRGEILANVWQTDRIARISPQDGRVLGWIDATGLLMPEERAQNPDVLNGIAYDAKRDRLFVTGKLWPKLFEIKLIPKHR